MKSDNTKASTKQNHTNGEKGKTVQCFKKCEDSLYLSWIGVQILLSDFVENDRFKPIKVTGKVYLTL